MLRPQPTIVGWGLSVNNVSRETIADNRHDQKRKRIG